MSVAAGINRLRWLYAQHPKVKILGSKKMKYLQASGGNYFNLFCKFFEIIDFIPHHTSSIISTYIMLNL